VEALEQTEATEQFHNMLDEESNTNDEDFTTEKKKQRGNIKVKT